MMEKLSDKELVEGMINNNDVIIQYFFFEQCGSLFRYVIQKVFDYRVEKTELINELYLYLQADDWLKLRQFDYRSHLMTWISVVAIRFFQKKRSGLIAFEYHEDSNKEKAENNEEQMFQKMDVENLINRLPNERYRCVIRRLILEDKEPQEVANDMKITVDNLYNIKRRALQQLSIMARKEVGYVE